MKYYIKNRHGEYFKEICKGLTCNIDEAYEYKRKEIIKVFQAFGTPDEIVGCPIERSRVEEAKKKADSEEQLFYAKHAIGYLRGRGHGISPSLSEAHKFTKSEFDKLPEYIKSVATLVPVQELEGQENETETLDHSASDCQTVTEEDSNSTSICKNVKDGYWHGTWRVIPDPYLNHYTFSPSSGDTWKDSVLKELKKIKKSLKKNKRVLKEIDSLL